MAKINWRGTEIADKVAAAAALAVDQTTANATNHAKQNHPWKNVTGTLEGSLQMRPAIKEGDHLVGQWGSFAVNYAIYLELGTRYMHPYPYLRPAADATYPDLARRIRENLAAL